MKRKKSEDIKAGGGESSDKHESENGKERQKDRKITGVFNEIDMNVFFKRGNKSH